MIKLHIETFRIMLKYTRHWGIFYIICSVTGAILTALQLFLLKNLIDKILGNTAQLLTFSVIFIVSLYILSYIFQALLNVLITNIDIKTTVLLMNNMNKSLFDKINKIDYVCFEDEEMYNIIQRIGDEAHEKIKSVFFSSLQTLNAFIVLFGVSLIFLQVSYILALSLIFVLVGVVFFSTKGMEIFYSKFRKQSKDKRILNYYNELLYDKNSVLELKIFNAVSHIVEKRKLKEKAVIKELMICFIQSDAVYNLSTILTVAWVIIALFITGRLVVNFQVSIGLLAAVIQASVSIIANIETLAYKVSDTISSIESVRYYNEFQALPERVTTTQSPLSYTSDTPDISGTQGKDIEFNNVSFAYPGTNNPVLKDVTFSFNANEKVAIVGANGAGKSTIIKLLLNLFPVDGGTIKTKVKVISPVFQDYVNYYLSLRENVAFGDIQNIRDDQKIRDSLFRSQASDIEKLSDKGLETNFGKLTDDGIDLSGGQWQRLAIARGLFPSESSESFVVLDEPTASMDPIAESQMYMYFLNAMKNQGALIISHRLASAKLADKIFVLHGGVISEQGTHDELMKAKGLYYDMFSSQASWYNDNYKGFENEKN